MSYKTNPIANRLKVIKGWKNPYLPTKTLNYARDISLWFKVYLLLKTFLNLKKIQLLFCEIRFDQQNKKILYLVINKKKTQQKKRRKKSFSFKKIQTPIQKIQNLNSIFFLYQNLGLLKKSSFWNQNTVHKKVLSKFWLTKPKISTWINTFEKIINVRQKYHPKFKYLKKNQGFTPTQYLKLKFYTTKQKQILAQKLRLKKINSIFYAKLFELVQQKKSQFLLKVIENLKKNIDKNQFEIKKLNTVYKFLLFLNQSVDEEKRRKKITKKLVLTRLKRQQLIILQKRLIPEILSLNRTRFLKQKLPTFLFKKNSLSKNFLHLNFLISQIQNKDFVAKNYLLFSKFKSGVEKKITKKKINQTKVLNLNLELKRWLKANFKKNIKKKTIALSIPSNYNLIFIKTKKKKKKKEIRKLWINVWALNLSSKLSLLLTIYSF